MSRDDQNIALKPGSMRIAIVCLWWWLALSIVNAGLGIWRIDPALPNAMFILLVASIAMVVFLLFNSFLIQSVDRGRKWARNTFTALRGIGIPLSVLFAFPREVHSSWSVPLFLFSSLIALSGVILLFVPASSAWFDAANS